MCVFFFVCVCWCWVLVCFRDVSTCVLGEGRVESELLGFHHAGGEGSDQDWHPADQLNSAVVIDEP